MSIASFLIPVAVFAAVLGLVAVIRRGMTPIEPMGRPEGRSRPSNRLAKRPVRAQEEEAPQADAEASLEGAVQKKKSHGESNPRFRAENPTSWAINLTAVGSAALCAVVASLATQFGIGGWPFTATPSSRVAPTPSPQPHLVSPQPDHSTDLRDAVRLGHAKDIKKVLDDHPELARDSTLMRATAASLLKQGNTQVLREPKFDSAVKAAADTFVNEPLQDYGPILHVAARSGDQNTVALLLDKRPELANTLGGYGETLLQAAVDSQDLGMVKYVLRRCPAQITARGVNDTTALDSALGNRELWTSGEITDFAKLLLNSCPSLASMKTAGGELPDVIVNLWRKRLKDPEIPELADQIGKLLQEARKQAKTAVPGVPASNKSSGVPSRTASANATLAHDPSRKSFYIDHDDAGGVRAVSLPLASQSLPRPPSAKPPGAQRS